ncbi:NAD-dependent epimerase/dehydratase family protein [Pseudopedobacter sp.]|uniref:epimerase n=1 Tax=Pseudopedobacter sp. TaxID=1936787 RepID=UPI0033415163
MAKVILAGGTGSLGLLLTDAFLQRGDEVLVLTRRQKIINQRSNVKYVLWDGENLGDWVKEIEKSDVIINLSGERINKRFTAKNKSLLERSRFLPTQIIGTAIQKLEQPPGLWINFSGISIFSGVQSGIQDESSRQYGTDFLASLTQKWESIVYQTNLQHTNKIILRISPVLSRNSGMFKELYPIVKSGLGGKVGNGKQYVSWIAETDFIRLVLWLVDNNPEHSVYHASSPFPVTNEQFMTALRQSAGIGFGLPFPKSLIKIGAFLKGIDSSLILSSVPAVSKFSLEEGFEFEYPYIYQTFNQLIKYT